MNPQFKGLHLSKLLNLDEPFALNLPLVPQSLDFTCGPACFSSMYKYYQRTLPGKNSGANGGPNYEPNDEMHFAKKLGTLDLGFTPPENIISLALDCGFKAELREAGTLKDIQLHVSMGAIVFVTWWDEDAGHYSLVERLTENEIILMDPWLAREGKLNSLAHLDFVPKWEARHSRLISVSPRLETAAFKNFAEPNQRKI